MPTGVVDENHLLKSEAEYFLFIWVHEAKRPTLGGPVTSTIEWLNNLRETYSLYDSCNLITRSHYDVTWFKGETNTRIDPIPRSTRYSIDIYRSSLEFMISQGYPVDFYQTYTHSLIFENFYKWLTNFCILLRNSIQRCTKSRQKLVNHL